MKKFKMYYQGVRTSNKIGGFFKNKRFVIVEYNEESYKDQERLGLLLDLMSRRYKYKCTTPDLGYACVEVSNVEEFYEFRILFRDREEKLKYYDPEYGRLVDEDAIRSQYESFNKESWFHKSYEEFLADNFEKI